MTWLLSHPHLLTSHLGVFIIGIIAKHYLAKLGVKEGKNMEEALAILNAIIALIPTAEKLEPEVVQAFEDVKAAIITAIASIKAASNKSSSTPAA
jgi:hypothetical protein